MFLENPDVPPENNAVDRGFRLLKVKDNASKTFRSAWGADVFLMIQSILRTYKKLGRTAKDAVRYIVANPC